MLPWISVFEVGPSSSRKTYSIWVTGRLLRISWILRKACNGLSCGRRHSRRQGDLDHATHQNASHSLLPPAAASFLGRAAETAAALDRALGLGVTSFMADS